MNDDLYKMLVDIIDKLVEENIRLHKQLEQQHFGSISVGPAIVKTVPTTTNPFVTWSGAEADVTCQKS